ncbi:Protein of unknown function [Streptomyces sp. 1222.5]|uniref:DUF4232 domain-containing protein n=1 Tax=unclassified Streptomyces TaxID=2593676 RepID=UPI000897CCAF|nr:MULTISPECIES: DUF4232 domain-containing protein [unclassified Streptomyces]PKW05946.1 uncharacterized protein DUF4232 [Streptomyces sp. 5112.2]SED24754.1 Protein of unknown function [Streptomyces sp. 1222.5]
MHLRATIAVSAASAATAALLLTAPQSQAATGRAPASPCAEKALTVRAKAVAADRTVVRMSVTNRGARACAVDRVPTVTFGDLDGAALPVPAGGAAAYRLAAGGTAYADVRTIGDPADPEARRTDSLTVAASAAHWGRSFTAARLGTGRKVLVWEPVTTWWKASAAAADRAIGLS